MHSALFAAVLHDRLRHMLGDGPRDLVNVAFFAVVLLPRVARREHEARAWNKRGLVLRVFMHQCGVGKSLADVRRRSSKCPELLKGVYPTCAPPGPIGRGKLQR